MKRNNKIISGTIVASLVTMVTLMAGNGEVNEGGNGEVSLTESCFTSTKHLDQCLEKLYPKINVDNVAFVSLIKEVLKVTRTKGDGKVISDDLNLTNQKRFIIYANISEVKKPVSINIPKAKIIQNEKTLIVDIDTKDIKDKIIIQNSKKENLIEYTVIENK